MTDDQPTIPLRDVVEQQGSIRAAARHLGIAESTLRGRLRKEPPPPLPDNAFTPTAHHFPASHVDDQGVETLDMSQGPGRCRRFILTSAQNNVHVHEGFLKNLEALSKNVDATLIVSYSLYDRAGYRGLVAKGDTQIKKRDLWFDKRTEKYAVNTRVKLAKRLAFCGELDILATTKNPLSGMESYCGRSSIIVPHNKFAFHCVESRKHQMPKEMFTTGSVTPRKFIQRKAGQLAHFHHVLGALLVEVQETGHFHVHHLNAEEDGSFYWLDKHVKNSRVKQNRRGIEAMILGDIHVEKSDDEATTVTRDAVQDLRPKAIVLHDLIDFRSRNHHNRNDPIFKIKMHQEGTSIRNELDQARKFINGLLRVGRSGMRVAVARGNHDAAFDRWVKETDWRDDPVNAELYLSTAAAMVRAARQGRSFNALKYNLGTKNWSFRRAGRWVHPTVSFLGLDESYEIAGIECGMHGHVGPSGTRGMPTSFRKLGFKSFTAHTHTPSIYDGAYTVGVTGSLNMGYNVGPSKWLQCHGIIYPNGKRAFLFLKNGKYRA